MAKKSDQQILKELDRIGKKVDTLHKDSIPAAEKELEARKETPEEDQDDKTKLENEIGEKVLKHNANRNITHDERDAFLEDMKALLTKYKTYELTTQEKAMTAAAERIVQVTMKQMKKVRTPAKAKAAIKEKKKK